MIKIYKNPVVLNIFELEKTLHTYLHVFFAKATPKSWCHTLNFFFLNSSKFWEKKI